MKNTKRIALDCTHTHTLVGRDLVPSLLANEEEEEEEDDDDDDNKEEGLPPSPLTTIVYIFIVSLYTTSFLCYPRVKLIHSL